MKNIQGDLKQKLKSEATKAKILEAARIELASKGYAGFRISNIATIAGVSKGALTHHFESKEHLIKQLIGCIYEVEKEESFKRLDELSGDNILDHLIDDFCYYYLGDTFKISISLLSLEEYEPELHRDISKITREFRLVIEEKWFEKLHEFGLSDHDAKTILSLSQTMLRGIKMRLYLVDDKAYIKFTLDEWKKMLRQLFPILNTEKEEL